MVCNSVVNIFAEQFELNYIVVTMTSGFDNSEWSNFEHGVPTVLRNYVFPFNGSLGTITQITVKNSKDGATAKISSFNEVYEKIRNDENFVNKCVSIKVLNSLIGIKADSNRNALFDGSMYQHTSEGGLFLLKPSVSSFDTISGGDIVEKTDGIDLLTYFSIKINNVIYEKESKLFNYPLALQRSQILMELIKYIKTRFGKTHKMLNFMQLERLEVQSLIIFQSIIRLKIKVPLF